MIMISTMHFIFGKSSRVHTLYHIFQYPLLVSRLRLEPNLLWRRQRPSLRTSVYDNLCWFCWGHALKLHAIWMGLNYLDPLGKETKVWEMRCAQWEWMEGVCRPLWTASRRSWSSVAVQERRSLQNMIMGDDDRWVRLEGNMREGLGWHGCA